MDETALIAVVFKETVEERLESVDETVAMAAVFDATVEETEAMADTLFATVDETVASPFVFVFTRYCKDDVAVEFVMPIAASSAFAHAEGMHAPVP